MNQLGINLTQILLQAINFGILLFVLKRYLYQPVVDMLNKRKAQVEATQKKEKELEQRLQKIEQQRDQVLQEAHEKAQQILTESRKQGDRVSEQIQKEAQQKAKDLLRQSEAETKEYLNQMKDELRSEVANVAIQTVRQILTTSLTEQQQQALTEESIKRFTEHVKPD